MTKSDKLIWKRKEGPNGKKFPPEKWGMSALAISREDRKTRERAYKVPQKLDIELSSKLREDFEDSVDHFHYQYTHLKKYPSSLEKKALMENLKNSAYAFARSLEDIKNPEIKRDIPMSPVHKSYSTIQDLIKTSKIWGTAASEAMPTGKPGRPLKSFIVDFALKLAKIFERATESPATAGYWDSTNYEIRGNDFPFFFAAVLSEIDKDASLLKKSGDPDEEVSENSLRNLHEFLKKVLSKK